MSAVVPPVVRRLPTAFGVLSFFAVLLNVGSFAAPMALNYGVEPGTFNTEWALYGWLLLLAMIGLGGVVAIGRAGAADAGVRAGTFLGVAGSGLAALPYGYAVWITLTSLDSPDELFVAQSIAEFVVLVLVFALGVVVLARDPERRRRIAAP